jgi:hypothetical protein
VELLALQPLKTPLKLLFKNPVGDEPGEPDHATPPPSSTPSGGEGGLKAFMRLLGWANDGIDCGMGGSPPQVCGEPGLQPRSRGLWWSP